MTKINEGRMLLERAFEDTIGATLAGVGYTDQEITKATPLVMRMIPELRSVRLLLDAADASDVARQNTP